MHVNLRWGERVRSMRFHGSSSPGSRSSRSGVTEETASRLIEEKIFVAVETPCAKPSSQPRRSQVSASTHLASPAKEVSVETKVVVVKTEHEASASSAAKEVPVARPPITVEEEKYVVEKTQLEAIGNVLP
ncbi:hypothetical protein Bca52824_023406 [Brassica carinata]|uniref:Uncharacterized protein n=1 Tax=Brassica carinata TaxID=52824 RepID=A0A8X7VI48_BRACI|nr:hypothetical protein Bca52824_023406 [Brassica carinata]